MFTNHPLTSLLTSNRIDAVWFVIDIIYWIAVAYISYKLFNATTYTFQALSSGISHLVHCWNYLLLLLQISISFFLHQSKQSHTMLKRGSPPVRWWWWLSPPKTGVIPLAVSNVNAITPRRSWWTQSTCLVSRLAWAEGNIGAFRNVATQPRLMTSTMSQNQYHPSLSFSLPLLVAFNPVPKI